MPDGQLLGRCCAEKNKQEEAADARLRDWSPKGARRPWENESAPWTSLEGTRRLRVAQIGCPTTADHPRRWLGVPVIAWETPFVPLGRTEGKSDLSFGAIDRHTISHVDPLETMTFGRGLRHA